MSVTDLPATPRANIRTAAAYRAAVLASGPALYWPLASDASSVVGPVGTVTGAVYFLQPDPWSGPGAATFDGRTGFIYDTTLDPHNALPFTAEWWYRTTVKPGGCFNCGDRPTLPMQHGGFSPGGYIDGNGKLVAFVYPASPLDPAVSSDGVWHHAAVIFDGSNVRLIRDGLQVATQANVAPQANPAVRIQVGIGGNTNRGGWFTGSLCHFAWYLRALPLDEVAGHFTASEPGPPPPGTCIRRAWLVNGSDVVPLEDREAGYYCTELDLGYPEVRDVMSNRPDSSGVFDRTALFGSRAMSANIVAHGGTMTVDEIGSLFAPFMLPHLRPELHYVLERPSGNPERWTTVRASGYSWPISGGGSREIHLSWVAADPIMADPVQRVITARTGTAGQSGRAYNLTFPRTYPTGNYPPTTATFSSNGDVPVRPVVRVFGPITSPVVTFDPEPGSDTPQLVAFDAGFRIDAGVSVDVDSASHSAVRSDGVSVLADLDWSRTVWPLLEPAPTYYVVRVAGGSTGPNSGAEVRWHDGYLT